MPVVPSQEEFDALKAQVTAIETKIAAIETTIIQIPQDVKDAFAKVLGWLQTNV